MSAVASPVPTSAVPSSAGRSLILAAMKAELAPILARVEIESEMHIDGIRVFCGSLSAAPVALAVMGEGAGLARRTVERLLAGPDIRRVVVVGVAGGLSPDLHPGQIVVADRVLTLEDGCRGRLPTRWIPSPKGALHGTVVSSPGILSLAREKQAAWARTGRPPVAVVDLETAAALAVADERGVPGGAIRVVCDPAEEDLPFDLEACRTRSGRVARLRVVARALLRPDKAGRLWDLQRRVRHGSGRLAAALAHALERDGEMK